jgi:hypothetical protein
LLCHVEFQVHVCHGSIEELAAQGFVNLGRCDNWRRRSGGVRRSHRRLTLTLQLGSRRRYGGGPSECSYGFGRGDNLIAVDTVGANVTNASI